MQGYCMTIGGNIADGRSQFLAVNCFLALETVADYSKRRAAGAFQPETKHLRVHTSRTRLMR